MDTQKISNDPFANDAEYLDSEFHWLRHHVRLLDLKNRIEDIAKGDSYTDMTASRVGESDKVATKELTRLITVTKAETEKARKALDARLEAHRNSGAFKLGMDTLCDQYQLTQEERLILLTLALPAVSGVLATDIYTSMGVYGGALPIKDGF